jgi:tetratricopeptide (TPR) repeat protein
LFLTYQIYNYWRADVYYNNARNFNKNNKVDEATQEINKAISISPNEPLYLAELALAKKDVDLSAKALDLNPYNQNIRNILISNLSIGSKETKEYLIVAEQIAEMGTQIAPMNPKIHYQLGILNLKNNNLENGLSSLEKAVLLKPNYKEGRFALGLTYIDVKNYEKAKENLEYILNSIDPNDELTKKYLEQAKSASE